MVSVIVSKWVGDAFGRDGIYDEQVRHWHVLVPVLSVAAVLTCDAQIIMNGYPHLDNKAEYAPEPAACPLQNRFRVQF
jgi:hypothetical protein